MLFTPGSSFFAIQIKKINVNDGFKKEKFVLQICKRYFVEQRNW